MRIIDFHTHPLYDFHLRDTGIDITPEIFRADLLANGVCMACGSVIYDSIDVRHGVAVEEYARIVPELNRRAMECRDILGDFYVPGIHIHPAFVELSCEEIEKAHARGVRLVGELVPYMMGWKRYSAPETVEILRLAAEYGMVVSMHPSNYEDMDALATALPNLKIVYAHLGGYGGYEGHLELMRRHGNVCFDYSAHGSDFDGTLRRAIDAAGRDRILYGTDYPGAGPAADKAAVLFEGLTDAELEAVFSLNAARLLGL